MDGSQVVVTLCLSASLRKCYGKNAHSVGGADWREEMARALVQ